MLPHYEHVRTAEEVQDIQTAPNISENVEQQLTTPIPAPNKSENMELDVCDSQKEEIVFNTIMSDDIEFLHEYSFLKLLQMVDFEALSSECQRELNNVPVPSELKHLLLTFQQKFPNKPTMKKPSSQDEMQMNEEKAVVLQVNQTQNNDSRVTLLSVEEVECVQTIEKKSCVHAIVNNYYLNETAHTLQQANPKTIWELLFQDSCNSEIRMSLVLQWLKLARIMEKEDLWSTWKTLYVQEDKVNGGYVLQLDVLDILEAADGTCGGAKSKSDLTMLLKKILITSQLEQEYALERTITHMGCNLYEYVFDHGKILDFFHSYANIAGSLSRTIKDALDDELNRLFKFNSSFDWSRNGSICDKFCSTLGIDVRKWYNTKSVRYLGAFLGNVQEWWTHTDRGNIITVVLFKGAEENANSSIFYSWIRDEIDPMLFIKFYKAIKRFEEFRTLFL